MRICIIAPPNVAVPPPAYGGTEAVIDTLARGLDAAGHEVLLVTTGDSSCPVPRSWSWPEAVGVGVGGTNVELRHVVHAYDVAASFQADVVHDHTLFGPLYAATAADCPIVTTNHGPFAAPELAGFFRAIAGHASIVAISHDQAVGAGSIPIAATIHHGVDLDRFPVGEGTGGYALFLGRMHPDKGVHVAARVARRAGVRLVIAAKMSEPLERAYFEQEVRPLLGSGIEYVGEVGGPEKIELLGGARCLLNPIQWSEPFGMVMIEAMATGTPVVATPVGSVPEIVTDAMTGFLRQAEGDLAAAVCAAEAIERRVCRATVERRFSAERLVADHVELYERLALASEVGAVA